MTTDQNDQAFSHILTADDCKEGGDVIRITSFCAAITANVYPKREMNTISSPDIIGGPSVVKLWERSQSFDGSMTVVDYASTVTTRLEQND